jgi:mannosyl-oligosaccharide glucosidase
MVRVSGRQGLLLSLSSLFIASVGAQVAEIEKATNDSLLWGPYRPNLYFGVRPRIPKSLMGGLMWTRVEDYASVQNSEHPLRYATVCAIANTIRLQTHLRTARA